MSKHPPEIAYPDSLCAPETERAILSCFLADPRNLIGRFHEIGSLEWFHHVVYRGMAEEMFELLEAKDTFDNVMLFQHLSDKGLMEKFGGPSFLAEINNFVPTPAHFPYYCEELSAKHLLRQSWAKLLQAKDRLVEHHDSLQEKGDLILGDLAAVEALFREQNKPKTLDDQIAEWQEDWNAKRNKEKHSGMPTRWPEFNLKMGGLNDGYTLIGGEYSSGKSVLMRNLLVDACILRHQRPGALFSYETSAQDMISGMVCDIGGVPSPFVFRPDTCEPHPPYTKSIAHALDKIRGSKLQIIDDRSLSADGLASKARALHDKHGDLVVGVDYLQKIPRPTWIEKNATSERELAANSDTMQKVSQKMPVIMAIQINKDGSSRGSEAVMMDGDMALRIEGDKGIYVTKFKKGQRFFHLNMQLEPDKLRFVESQPVFP